MTYPAAKNDEQICQSSDVSSKKLKSNIATIRQDCQRLEKAVGKPFSPVQLSRFSHKPARVVRRSQSERVVFYVSKQGRVGLIAPQRHQPYHLKYLENRNLKAFPVRRSTLSLDPPKRYQFCGELWPSLSWRRFLPSSPKHGTWLCLHP